MPLEIDTTIDDGITTFGLSGDLDSMTAGTLEAQVKDTIAGGEPRIVFDMAGLKYVSSFGLRVIIYTAKSMRGHGDRFVLHSVQDDVRGILKISGFEKFLKIADDAASARAAVAE